MLTALGDWLVLAPLWAIGLVIFGGLVGAALIGDLLRRHRKARRVRIGRADPEEGDQALTMSSVMGLLALLLAFTFSIALDRFDTRRTNVLLEANAVGTTYLRAQLLDEPHRARISKLLTDYTDTRIALAAAPRGSEQRALLKTSDNQISDLWAGTVAAFPSIRSNNLSQPFFESMNALIDMDAARKAGRQAHVPSIVFLALFLYQITAAAMISFVVGGRTSRRTAWVLFLLLGLFLLLIIDIDRPTSGTITESQEPMIQLQAFLRDNPPASFDRFNPQVELPTEAQ